MCGIAGFIDTRATPTAEEHRVVIERMTGTLRHRGPDDHGIWLDPRSGVALGHRRLAIVDLSPAGRQPMVSRCGRYVIAYNGEVFSYREIRADLMAAGVALRGHSDTEVIVEAVAQWGLAATLPRLIGMFAIALWDRDRQTLTLVRDRLGIKPLYWMQAGGLFLFGSELKALRAHPGWSPQVDPDAVAAFLRFGYVPAPFSIYRGVRKLEPGSWLEVVAGQPPRCERYWRLGDVIAAARGGADRAQSDAEAAEAMHDLLRDAVARRMVADVPVGALLSGGVDSTLVAALMQAQCARPIRTFTIGFAECGFDEAPVARAIARHLGTEHTELYVGAPDALRVVPQLSEWWDEPFADSSQIPTYLLCRLARQYVTVALSGDGGDEVFSGYTRYWAAANLLDRIARLPRRLRVAGAMALGMLPSAAWERMAVMLPLRWRPSQLAVRVQKFAAALTCADVDAFYLSMVSLWPHPERIVVTADEVRGVFWEALQDAGRRPTAEHLQAIDTITYLPDDILTKVDRASMAVALEVRVPLLDHRVVEAAWRLPAHMKLRNGTTKWILRQILRRYVPPGLVRLPKYGFSIPLGRWLRGPLRPWAEELLDEKRLKDQGLIAVAPVRQRWQQHLRGHADWSQSLWAVLMLQAWWWRHIDRQPAG